MKNLVVFPIRNRLLTALVVAGVFLWSGLPARGANILFVVNSFVDPTTPSNAHDQEVMSHLAALGHTVTLGDDDTVPVSALNGIDTVLISSSTGSGAAGLQAIAANLKSSRLSVISYEPGIYDELGLQTATAFGNAGGHISLGIVTANHPLAAGKTGIVQIVEDGTTATLSYTPAPPFTLGTDAIIIATNATVDVGRVATWAHERGSRLADNATITPGRKVALFFNATTAPFVYNTNAYAMFDAALAWALQPAPTLAIIAAFKSPTAANASPNAPLIVELEDGTAQVVQNSITLSLNGATLPTPTITKTGAVTRVFFQPANLFAAGSTNTLRIVYSDNAVPSKSFTNQFIFVAAPYVTLPSTYAFPISSANATTPGFLARVAQANVFSGILANSETRAEAQLAGTLFDPALQTPYANEANLANAGSDGFFVDSDVVNWSQNPAGAQFGNFRSPEFPDEPIPGIPGTDGINTDNIAAEVVTFLELQPGAYTLGVNSDDGFVASFGTAFNDVFRTKVGRFDGGRGAADSLFSFVAPAAGLYPFRVLYYEGNNDANLEIFSVVPATGEKVLINNRTNANGIKAWRQITAQTRPFINAISPAPSSVGVAVTNNIELEFINGTAALNTNSIQIRLNGTLTPITSIEANGPTNRVILNPSADLANFTTYTVQVIYSDNAATVRTVTNQFSFQTIRRPIQQQADGLAVVEAEQFSANTPQGQHAWVPTASPAGFSGTGTMYASPDAPGATINYPQSLTTSPRLDFQINFVKAGTHYFWFRGSDGGGNSINAGIDGDTIDVSMNNIDNGCCGTRLVPDGTSYTWVGASGATRSQFEVFEPGLHTINVWMREDGQIVDKILITTNLSFTPTGVGPDQSPRVGQASPTISITSPTNNATVAAGNVAFIVNATDDGSVRKVEFFQNGIKIGESTNAPFSFTWTSATNGIYTITARATDNEDLAATSAGVQITVGVPPPQVAYIRSAAGSAGDTAVVARLRARGFQVTEIVDSVSTAADANGKALLVISSTVGSGNVAKYAATAVPTVIWETAAYDDFGFDANNAAGATVATQTEIDIIDATHPLAAGLPAGTNVVYTTGRDISALATAYEGVKVVATLTDGTARPVVFAIETGAPLLPARLASAPARRAGVYLGNDTYTFTTDSGKRLFDAAVDWAMGVQTSNQPQMTVAKQGNQVVISWTNGGALEWTASLGAASTWTPLPAAPNPYSETIGATNRFFRVRK